MARVIDAILQLSSYMRIGPSAKLLQELDMDLRYGSFRGDRSEQVLAFLTLQSLEPPRVVKSWTLLGRVDCSLGSPLNAMASNAVTRHGSMEPKNLTLRAVATYACKKLRDYGSRTRSRRQKQRTENSTRGEYWISVSPPREIDLGIGVKSTELGMHARDGL